MKNTIRIHVMTLVIAGIIFSGLPCFGQGGDNNSPSGDNDSPTSYYTSNQADIQWEEISQAEKESREVIMELERIKEIKKRTPFFGNGRLLSLFKSKKQKSDEFTYSPELIIERLSF